MCLTRARRRCPAAVVVAVCLLLAPVTAAAQPRVRLIATGGTIGNHSDGRLSATALLASAPALRSIARVETETFSNVSSVELTLSDWLHLTRRVIDVLDDSEMAGVIVTCGSDTLEELAWWLHLTVPGDRPVVVTGAMRRPSHPQPDGPQNLADAVRVAVSPAATARGTLVVVGGAILGAREATKRSLSDLDAFASRAAAPVGTVEAGRVRFGRAAAADERLAYDVSALTALPRVDVLLTYQNAPGDLIDAAVRAGARGLVIAAAGAGAVTPAQADAIEEARRAGVVVVVSSRVPEGRLSVEDVPKGTIAAGSLSPIKARIVLMLALAAGQGPAAITEIFSR